MPHPLVLALAVIIAPLAAPRPAVTTPTSPTEAVIVNSGSTNTAGYVLRVSADGNGTLRQDGDEHRVQVSRALADRFFADLRAAGPLDALPHTFCMKSASFGTTTTVAYRGKRSPDLNCPSGSAGTALVQDARAIAAAAGVTVRRRPLVR
ncbi:MAG TPA: hypothetical protein VMA36_09455 [Candidatus Limnocylindria bacterium]|jgi:hypothetical protein|nr:hypothetical protein [Candidatus Limnocylindria bacterium]